MNDMWKVLIFGLAVILAIFGMVMLLKVPSFESECRAARGTLMTDSQGYPYCYRSSNITLPVRVR